MKDKITPGDKPLVSVIMTVYNGEKYLEEAVRSVLSQTYRGLELVVIDDGSVDGSGEILERLAKEDERLRVKRISNSGLSAARNAALEIAGGEVVMFADSDDMLHPQSVERLVSLMREYDVDVAVGRLVMTEDPPRGWYDKELTVGSARVLSGEQAMELSLYQRPVMNSVCQIAVKRSFFEGAAGLRFVEGMYYEDLELTSRLYPMCRRVLLTDMDYYFYRQNPGSIVHRMSDKRFHALEVTRQIEERMSRLSPSLGRAASDRRFSANFNIFLLLCREENGEYNRVRETCWREIKGRRRQILFNPRVRLKNRIGALISYSGRRVVEMLAGMMKG